MMRLACHVAFAISLMGAAELAPAPARSADLPPLTAWPGPGLALGDPSFRAAGHPTLALSPDGKLWAAAGAGVILVGAVAEGRVVRTIPDPHGPDDSWVLAFGMLREALVIASARLDATIVYDVASGEIRRRLPGSLMPAFKAEFSRDGARLAVFATEGARVFEPVYGGELAVFAGDTYETGWSPPGGYRASTLSGALSPDGKLLFLGDDVGLVSAYDIATRKHRVTYGPRGNDDPDFKEGSFIAVSPDGRLLATVLEPENEAVVRELASGRVVMQRDRKVRILAFSPDGRTLATAGETVWFWDLETRNKRSAVMVRADAMAWVDNDTLLVKAGTLQLVRASSGTIVTARADHSDRIATLAFLASDRPVTVDTTGRIIVWRGDGTVESMRDLGLFDADNVYALSHDGHRLYVGRPIGDDHRESMHAVYEVLSGKELRSSRGKRSHAATWAGPDRVLLGSYPLATWGPSGFAAFEDDEVDGGSEIAVSDDGAVVVARVNSFNDGETTTEFLELVRCDARGKCGPRLHPCPRTARVMAESRVAVSGDGMRYAIQCTDGHVVVSGFAASKEPRLRVPVEKASPSRLALSKDGARLAVSGKAGRLEVWEVAGTRRLLDLETGRPGGSSVVFDSTGTRLLLVAGDERPLLLDVP